jgi:hypothetical protein
MTTLTTLPERSGTYRVYYKSNPSYGMYKANFNHFTGKFTTLASGKNINHKIAGWDKL